MKQFRRLATLMGLGLFAPFFGLAQGVAGEIKSLQSVLDQLYKDMLPLCGSLIGVGRSIAGFASVWYIAARVWRNLAAAEPIDFYPLFRPFAIGLAVGLWPGCIAIMNAVLQPTVTGTSLLVDKSNQTIADLLKQKEDEIKTTSAWQALVGESGEGDRDVWMKYYHKDEVANEGIFGKIGNDVLFSVDKVMYNFKNTVKQTIAILLQIIYEAASLCINTLRTFRLILLAIVGPLVLGLSIFDGFQHILAVYLARYVNIFLWLPICNILGALLGKIQENMLKIDLTQIAQTGDTFFSSYDLGYIIFLIIGIICFFTVPTIAEDIVHVGGANALQQRVTQKFQSAAIGTAGAVVAGGASMVSDAYGNLNSMMNGGIAPQGQGDYFKDGNPYMRDKISGRS